MLVETYPQKNLNFAIHLTNHTRVLDEDTVRVRVCVRLCVDVTVLVLLRVGVTVEDFVLLGVCVGDGGLDDV